MGTRHVYDAQAYVQTKQSHAKKQTAKTSGWEEGKLDSHRFYSFNSEEIFTRCLLELHHMTSLSTEEVESDPSSAWRPLMNVKALSMTGEVEPIGYIITMAHHRKAASWASSRGTD